MAEADPGHTLQYVAQGLAEGIRDEGRVNAVGVEVLECLLTSKSDQTRLVAALSLAALDHMTEAVIDELIAKLQTFRNYSYTYYSFSYYGWSYAPAKIAETLSKVSPPTDPIIAALTEILAGRATGDWPLRQAAAEALGNIRPASDQIVTALSRRLSDTSMNVRCAAIAALVRLGASDDATLAALERRLFDRHLRVRLAAEAALEDLRNS